MSDIRLVFRRRWRGGIVPAERVMLEDFVELSVARTTDLRVGDKENIVFFVAACVERICFRPFAILGNSIIVGGVALEIFGGHIVLPYEEAVCVRSTFKNFPFFIELSVAISNITTPVVVGKEPCEIHARRIASGNMETAEEIFGASCPSFHPILGRCRKRAGRKTEQKGVSPTEQRVCALTFVSLITFLIKVVFQISVIKSAHMIWQKQRFCRM